ncbi:hypothetical protein EMIT0210MI2_13328 [Priestia megaterium]
MEQVSLLLHHKKLSLPTIMKLKKLVLVLYKNHDFIYHLFAARKCK